MTDIDVIEALDSLAQDASNRTKIGRLRAIYSSIEKTRSAGVADRLIVETLNNFGFELSIKTFQRMMLRLRREGRQATDVDSAKVQPLQAKVSRDPERAVRAELEGQARATVPSKTASLRSNPQAALPDDWRTAELTPEQAQSMTPEQRRERRAARDAMLKATLFPNPLAELPGAKRSCSDDG